MGGFNPGQLQQMLAQARAQYAELQKKMQNVVIDYSSGGGGVTVKMNGQKQLLSVTIDPETVRSGAIEMLPDLITDAVSGADRNVEEEMQLTVGGRLGG